MKRLFLSCFVLFSITFITSGYVEAAEVEDYYTLIAKDSDEHRKLMELVKNNEAKIVYSIEELGVLQIKTYQKNMDNIKKSDLIDTSNLSMETIKSPGALKNPSLFSPSKTLKSPELFSLSSDFWDVQWDMKKVTNNGESYKLFSGSKNVNVGIIDSGIDINHNDLKANIVAGSKNLVPKNGFRGKEPEETGEIDQLTDKLGHGTHVAGQIAANGKIKGVAPNIGIKSYRVLGEENAESLWIVKAIIEAANDDVDVINISLGDYLLNGVAILNNNEKKRETAEIKAYKKAIKYAKKQGSIIVAAAGNDSLNIHDQEQMYNRFKKKMKNSEMKIRGEVLDVPASLPSVVTVASVGPSDEMSLFSNYGTDFIDIAAPGGDTRLLKQYGDYVWGRDKMHEKEQIISTVPNQRYFYSYGNSMAAPKVSGALALIIDKYHLKDQPNKAINFLYKNGVSDIKNDSLGHGVLDVYKALSK